jgi:hypothetical protein
MGCGCLFGLVEGVFKILGFVIVGLCQILVFLLIGLCKILAFLLIGLGALMSGLVKTLLASAALTIAAVASWRATRKGKVIIHSTVSEWKEWQEGDGG